MSGGRHISRRRKATIFVCVLVGVPLLLYAVFALTLGRSPLAGDDHHDFGRVEIPVGGELVVEHVFELTNRTSSVIHIEQVVPSCGCTAVQLSTRDVDPGAVLTVTAEVTLRGPPRKDLTVALLMEGRGARVLTMDVEVVR